MAAGGGSERKATEKEGKPTKGFVATLTTAWAIGLDPVEFSEDPYEECFRTSTGDERRKYVFISSHLPPNVCHGEPRVPFCFHTPKMLGLGTVQAYWFKEFDK